MAWQLGKAPPKKKKDEKNRLRNRPEKLTSIFAD
jgi:ribosomal protein S30